MAMQSSKRTEQDALAAHYRPLARLIADLVTSALRPANDGAFYTQHDAPLKRRIFLAAARRGAFASFCVGRTVFARRADVHAFIERCARVVEPVVETNEGDELGELLDSAGIRGGRRGERRGRR